MQKNSGWFLSAPVVLTIALVMTASANVQAQIAKTIRVFKSPTVANAQAAFTTSVLAARKAYGQSLEGALRTAMTAGNLPEANAINIVKAALDAGGDLKEANAMQDEINDISGVAVQPGGAVARPAGVGGTTIESADVAVTGTGFTSEVLEDGAKSWTNRTYRWANVPAELKGARYTRMNGGVPAEVRVRAKRDTTVLVFTDINEKQTRLPGWQKTKMSFTSSGNKADIVVFSNKIYAGQEIKVPQVNWAGTMVVVTGT